MNTYELAEKLWKVLTSAAHNRQVLTYELAGKPLGLGPNLLSDHLGQIQRYCERNKLPFLPILVVSKETGRPKSGFPAVPESESCGIINIESFPKEPVRHENSNCG